MNKRLYKFLHGYESENGDHEWIAGKWYKVEGELELCDTGFHASKHIQDALRYVQGDTLAVVEVKGESIEGDDKQCWREMRVVKTYLWSKIESLKLAIFSAEQCIDDYIYDDKYKLQECIDISKKILKKLENNEEITEEDKSAAESAAWSAAWSASESARSARSAAWSAEESARSAAWNETERKKEIHEYCLKIVENGTENAKSE